MGGTQTTSPEIVELQTGLCCLTEVTTNSTSNFDESVFKRKVSEIKWDELYGISDVNLAWNFIETNLMSILQIEAPVITCQPTKKHRVWVSQKTKDNMKLRDEARNLSKRTNDDEDKRKYKILRNKVTRYVRKDRIEHFRNIYNECEEKNDSAKLYKTAKIQAGWKSNGPPMALVIEGKNITSPKLIAQEQMKYFQSKDEKLLENVAGSEEINPIEILKMSVKKLNEAGKHIPTLKFREVSQQQHSQTHKQPQGFQCMGTG